MQFDKKLNPSHPTGFVSVFLIEDVIQQPETWEENIHQGKPSCAPDNQWLVGLGEKSKIKIKTCTPGF